MAGPRFYHKNGKLYDAGVEISDKEAARIQKDYPEKMKANSENGGSDPYLRMVSDSANKLLQRDLDQVNKAVEEKTTYLKGKK